jgi:hypothetical protein
VDGMHVNGQSSQVKIKTLKSMMNGKDEIFLGGKDKVIK